MVAFAGVVVVPIVYYVGHSPDLGQNEHTPNLEPDLLAETSKSSEQNSSVNLEFRIPSTRNIVSKHRQTDSFRRSVITHAPNSAELSVCRSRLCGFRVLCPCHAPRRPRKTLKRAFPSKDQTESH